MKEKAEKIEKEEKERKNRKGRRKESFNEKEEALTTKKKNKGVGPQLMKVTGIKGF